MSIQSHIDRLSDKHFLLNQQIRDAYLHHLPAESLKKERLFVKDQIAQCKRHGA